MPDRDRIQLFEITERLLLLANGALMRALASSAPACRHPGGYLIDLTDPDRGFACAGECGHQLIAGLLLDPFCSRCHTAMARDGLVQLPTAGAIALARLCPACLTGKPAASLPPVDTPHPYPQVTTRDQPEHEDPPAMTATPTATPTATTRQETQHGLGGDPHCPRALPCQLCGVQRAGNSGYSSFGELCSLCRRQLSHPGLLRDWGGVALLAAARLNPGLNPDALRDLETAAAKHGITAWRDAAADTTPPFERFGWLAPETIAAARTTFLTLHQQRRDTAAVAAHRAIQAQREAHAQDPAGLMYR